MGTRVDDSALTHILGCHKECISHAVTHSGVCWMQVICQVSGRRDDSAAPAAIELRAVSVPAGGFQVLTKAYKALSDGLVTSSPCPLLLHPLTAQPRWPRCCSWKAPGTLPS